ncbi:MAG: PDZ domain-containing protein [Candidatus Solibacter usitatus]|nr:PDZ domain-containing protein [Candidatus Solibacter usitatus]
MMRTTAILRFARIAALASAPAVLPAQPAPPAPPPPASSGIAGFVQVMKVGGSFLGVGVQEVNAERSKELKLKEEYGVEVTRVEDDSPASKAGLKASDVVLEYNGQRVEGVDQFVRLVRETPAGRTVKMLVSRNGTTQTVSATIAARKAMKMSGMPGMAPMEGFKVEIPNFSINMPDIPKAMMSWRSSILGVEAESLGESQLAGYFGVKEGVLVRSVMKDTAAEKAGIRAGDVLTKVDENKVTAPRDVTAAIRSARTNAKKSLPVVLMREKKEMTVTVTLEDEGAAPKALPRGQKVTVKQLEL